MNTLHTLAPAQSHTPTIVFVDDEEEILFALRGLFRKEPYRISYFTSGQAALDFLAQNEADVIVSDMRMPEMSGTELLEKSARINPRAFRMILSGCEEKSIVLNALSQGFAEHYIMKPWSDDDLRATIRAAVSLQRKLKQQRLLEILSSHKSLPSPPRLHMRLLDLLKENHSQAQVADELEKHPALVAKLLHIANSVFYSVRNPVTSVHTAITFIGIDEVVNIVLGFEAFHNINKSSDAWVIQRLEQQWDMSVRRAQVARLIAAQWPVKIDVQEPYTAALMLDVGLVLRFCSAPGLFHEFESSQRNDHENPIAREEQFFGTNHAELSAAILTYWNFPASLVAAVANQHAHAGESEATLVTQIASVLVDGRNGYPYDPRVDAAIPEFQQIAFPESLSNTTS
ncbi:MAG: HDOD domain-containing protein [Ignavibacteriae bacterium]|nr:HDOD domain-containing protein [Ignavibacteriota bacterium]